MGLFFKFFSVGVLVLGVFVGCLDKEAKNEKAVAVNCVIYSIPFGTHFFTAVEETGFEDKAVFKAELGRDLVWPVVVEAKNGQTLEKRDPEDIRMKIICNQDVVYFNSDRQALMDGKKFGLSSEDKLLALTKLVEKDEFRTGHE